MFGRIKRRLVNAGYRRRCRGAVIDASALLEGVTLGAEAVTIGSDACLVDTTVGRRSAVGRECSICRGTLDESVRLGPETRLCDVTVGRYSYLAGHTTAHTTRFGRFCSVGRDLLSGLGEHPTNYVSTSPVFFSTRGQCGTTFAASDRFAEAEPVDVGSDVWIGARVFVRNGVRIGHGAVVAAGAVVVNDVPDYAIVGGAPARVIRMRFGADQIERLLALAWWDWSESRLRSAAGRFACDDLDGFLQWAEGSEGVD